MADAFICAYLRTPIGRCAGALSSVRADAGEDNRNVALVASLLAGLPVGVPGTTITPAGVALIDEISPERRAIYKELEARYGHAEMEKLLDMLEALIESQGQE